MVAARTAPSAVIEPLANTTVPFLVTAARASSEGLSGKSIPIHAGEVIDVMSILRFSTDPFVFIDLIEIASWTRTSGINVDFAG